MREFISLLSAVAVAFCLIASEASATTMTFTSSAAFNLALGGSPVTIEGWDTYALNSTIANGTTLNGVTYNAFPGGTLGRIDNQFNHFGTDSLALRRSSDPNPNKSFFNPGDVLSISFAKPIYVLGIFFNANFTNVGSLGILTTPIGTVTTGGTYDTGTFYFAGVISTTPQQRSAPIPNVPARLIWIISPSRAVSQIGSVFLHPHLCSVLCAPWAFVFAAPALSRDGAGPV